MGNVVNINPTIQLDKFFTNMYEDVEGYIYSPTKDPVSEDFEQYFFHWPSEKEQLIEHVTDHTSTHEVYYGPGIYTKPSGKQEDFKGTFFAWVEFDGQLPDSKTMEGIPTPSIKIRSSTENHEHWYWKLEELETRQEIIEDVNKRLAYHLGADLGCWSTNRVLRPPGTVHHESVRTTALLRWDLHPLAIQAFSGVPALPFNLTQENDIGHIPQALDVISKYLWDDEFLELLRANVVSKKEWSKLEETEQARTGKDRNAALTKLAHFCVEAIGKDGKKIKDAEILSILWNADERWGKYKKRRDRKSRLLAIINHVRSRHDPVDEAVSTRERLRVYNYSEFINTEFKLEWVVEGLIHKKGFVMVSGPPGVGKSQFSMRFALSLAQGKPFLKWTPAKPLKILLVSMEMPHEELLYFFEQMAVPENELLRENLLIMPLGYSLRLANTASQAEFATVIEEFKPDGIIMDSLGAGLAEDINSEKVILQSFDFVHKILRDHYGAFIWFIHHNRKEQIGNKKPKKLADLYGNQYIGAAVRTGIMLWPEPPNIEVSCMKLSLAKEFNSFNIRRQPGLDFSVVEGIKSLGDIPVFGDGTDLSDSI